MNWIDVRVHPSKPMSWWFNEFRRDRINMQPGYQRRSNLWSRWKKAHLIDSIINGFDVPKFYIADFNKSSNLLNESDQPYAVIDGKQRFEAIFSFFLNEYPLNPSSIYLADSSVNISKLRFSELRDRYPDIAERVTSFSPVVMSVATDAAGMIEQLFVRLNSGVSINGAERRNAMPGPLPQIVRDITVHPFFGDRVRFSKDRMQEFNLAAKLLMFEKIGGFFDTKAKNLDSFVMEAYKITANISNDLERGVSRRRAKELQSKLEEIEQPYKEAEQAVLENLDIMLRVFKKSDPLLTKQGAIPVYYWVIRNNPYLRKKFRAFLSEFDPAVLDNVRLARNDPDSADSELLAYYNALRTSNDKKSMETRYAIIISRYRAWQADSI